MERNGCMESRNHIELRTFQEKDFAEVLQLFYDTVRNINSRDYTPEQISAWVLGVDEESTVGAYHTCCHKQWENCRLRGYG